MSKCYLVDFMIHLNGMVTSLSHEHLVGLGFTHQPESQLTCDFGHLDCTFDFTIVLIVIKFFDFVGGFWKLGVVVFKRIWSLHTGNNVFILVHVFKY